MSLDSELDNAVSALKAYNALANPTAAQQTNIIKVLVQCVGRLIFARQNRPDDSP